MYFHRSLTDAPEFSAGDATKLREIMHPLKHNIPVGYSVARARVEAGAASLPHQLKSSESYYIIQGLGRMHINESSFEVKEGDIFLVPPDANQFIENIGDEMLVFLCIVEPYWQESEESIG